MNKELDDDFINALMISLQDERIIEKIKEIAEAAEADLFSQLREPKDLLKDKEIARLQQEIESKKEEINEYQIKVHNLNQKINSYFNELQKRRADYREAEELYGTVQQLSETTRNSLKRIFKGNTVQEFIVCGVQYENISSLWDFIKNEIMEGREQERGILLTLFQYFFQEYSKTYDTPLYKIQEVKINEVFREDLHIRTLNSKISGNVTEILLPGYISINGKIIKKSIVRI
jgi:DNA repair exonuclease SbcCD ATPase subunit